MLSFCRTARKDKSKMLIFAETRYFMKGVHIFLAEGFEPIEALAPCDVLRRGGLDARLVAIEEEPVVMSAHGIAVGPDVFLSELETSPAGISAADVMIFPGGMPGARNLAENKTLMRLMREHYAAGGTLAAICAAPGLVLSQLEEVSGVHFTCYEGFETPLLSKGAIYTAAGTQTSGRIITGRGPGYATEFGLAILAAVKGPDAAARVRSGMYLD